MILMLIISFIVGIIAAIVDGMLEGYGFDQRKSFERKFGKSPYSFWGSLSWENKNTFWFKVTGGVWDFYHLADDIRSYCYRIAGVFMGFYIISLLNAHDKWTLPAIILLAWLIIASLTKRLAMQWIRN